MTSLSWGRSNDPFYTHKQLNIIVTESDLAIHIIKSDRVIYKEDTSSTVIFVITPCGIQLKTLLTT